MGLSGYDINNLIHTQYTKGGEYSLNGRDYVGEYHIANNKAFTGPNGTIGSKELTKYYPHNMVYTYDSLFQFKKIESTFKQPMDAIIIPTEGDYLAGMYERYFLQSLIDMQKMPIEVSKTAYQSLGKPNGLDNESNIPITVMWTLTGPLRSYADSNGYIVQGIYEKNEAQVLKLSTAYPNIQYKLKNYLEFARPTFV